MMDAAIERQQEFECVFVGNGAPFCLFISGEDTTSNAHVQVFSYARPLPENVVYFCTLFLHKKSPIGSRG
jgi:hypothetical protein